MKCGTTYPSWSTGGGWTDSDPRKQNGLAYYRDPQIIEEVGSLVSYGAPLLYKLTWMFRSIRLVSLSVHRSSLVLFRESTEVGHHPLKGLSLRYEGSLHLLGHLYLM
jgi:hypothetical protein